LALVEVGGPVLEGGADLGWLDRFSAEHENLRAALRWSAQLGEREIGLRLASAAWRFWQLRGYTREGRGWFGRLLPTEDQEGAVELRAGNLVEARDWMEKGRRLHLEYGNRRRATDAAMVLSYIYFRLGDTSTAREHVLTALGETREMGDVARWPVLLELGVAM